MSTATSGKTQSGNNAEGSNEFDKLMKADYTQSEEMMQLRLENEMMMAECRSRPRRFEDMKNELTEMLEAFPAMADDAIYCKPVGSDGAGGKQKYAEGLSIRSAELLAEVYGFNRVECSTVDIDGDKVKIEAVFVDYQKGRVWKDSGVLSKWYKARGGGLQRIPDDRFYGVVAKGEASRRIREVILRSVNSALKAWFTAKCRELMDNKLDDAGIKSIVNNFLKIGVTLPMIEGVVGRPPEMGWTQEDRRQLLGIWNAIKQQETTVAEAFCTPGQNGESQSVTGANKSEQIANALKSKATKEKTVETKEESAESKLADKPASGPSQYFKVIEWLNCQPTVKKVSNDPERNTVTYDVQGYGQLTVGDGLEPDDGIDTTAESCFGMVKQLVNDGAKRK